MADLGYLTPSSNRTSTAYLSFGNTMMIQPDYKIYKMLKDDPLWRDGVGHNDWSYGDNTIELRLSRHLEIHKLVEQVSGLKSSWLQDKHVRALEKEMRSHDRVEV